MSTACCYRWAWPSGERWNWASLCKFVVSVWNRCFLFSGFDYWLAAVSVQCCSIIWSTPTVWYNNNIRPPVSLKSLWTTSYIPQWSVYLSALMILDQVWSGCSLCLVSLDGDKESLFSEMWFYLLDEQQNRTYRTQVNTTCSSCCCCYLSSGVNSLTCEGFSGPVLILIC